MPAPCNCIVNAKKGSNFGCFVGKKAKLKCLFQSLKADFSQKIAIFVSCKMHSISSTITMVSKRDR